MEYQANTDVSRNTSSNASFPYDPHSKQQTMKGEKPIPTEEEHLDSHDYTCSSCLTKYTQETSFSGLKYVGQKGSFFRR